MVEGIEWKCRGCRGCRGCDRRASWEFLTSLKKVLESVIGDNFKTWMWISILYLLYLLSQFEKDFLDFSLGRIRSSILSPRGEMKNYLCALWVWVNRLWDNKSVKGVSSCWIRERLLLKPVERDTRTDHRWRGASIILLIIVTVRPVRRL